MSIQIEQSTSQSNRFSINIVLLISIIFLPAMFFADGVFKYLTIYGDGFSRVSLMVRALFEVVILLYLLFNINKERLFYFIGILILFICFLFGQVLIDNFNSLTVSFVAFNKYIFLFIAFLFFKPLLDDTHSFLFVYKILIILFLLNMLFIFLGFIFEIRLFDTFFDRDYRYGYNGIFMAGNESSFVMMSMLAFFYFRTFYQNKSKLIFLFVFIASMLSGMKAVYIFIALLSIFHIVFKMKKILFLPLFLIALYSMQYIIPYLESEHFQALVAFFSRTLEEKGLLYMMLSGRSSIVENELPLVIGQWNFLNIFFGGRDVSVYIMEMDLIDLFLFFGVFGSLIYSYLFYKSFVQKFFGFNFYTFFIFIVLVLSFFGGHFMTSPTAGLYFGLVIIYFKKYRSKKYEKNLTY